MENIKELLEMINDAELVLVGIGEEFLTSENSETDVLKAYENIADVLGEKNYFIVSLCNDDIIYSSGLKIDKITAPFSPNESNNEDEGKSQWDKYMMWLSCTLNKKLLVLELGVLLNAPQVIRWPFEKTVMYNNKAQLIRINEIMPNIPSEISEKAKAIKKNGVEFCL